MSGQYVICTATAKIDLSIKNLKYLQRPFWISAMWLCLARHRFQQSISPQFVSGLGVSLLAGHCSSRNRLGDQGEHASVDQTFCLHKLIFIWIRACNVRKLSSYWTLIRALLDILWLSLWLSLFLKIANLLDRDQGQKISSVSHSYSLSSFLCTPEKANGILTLC